MKPPISASIIPQSAHQRYQHQGMSSTSVQGIRNPTPTPSPSPVHKFPTGASIISQSAHQRYHHQDPTSNTRANEFDHHTAGVVPLNDSN
jgi:hypothetical protein